MDGMDRCSGELAFAFIYEGDAVLPKGCGCGCGRDVSVGLVTIICARPPP